MDSLSDGAVDEIAWMLELESVNIEIPRGEWSMLYSILQKNPNAIVYFLTSSEGKIDVGVGRWAV